MREAPPVSRHQPPSPIDGALIFASLLAVAFAVTAIICYVDEFKLKRELEQVWAEARGQVNASISKQGDMERKATEVDQKAKNAERLATTSAQKVGELREALEIAADGLKAAQDELGRVKTKSVELKKALADALEVKEKLEFKESLRVEAEMKVARKPLGVLNAEAKPLMAWHKSHWALVKRGMDPSEILAFADTPARIEERADCVYWYYLALGEGTVFIRFEAGKVTDFGLLTR